MRFTFATSDLLAALALTVSIISLAISIHLEKERRMFDSIRRKSEALLSIVRFTRALQELDRKLETAFDAAGPSTRQQITAIVKRIRSNNQRSEAISQRLQSVKSYKRETRVVLAEVEADYSIMIEEIAQVMQVVELLLADPRMSA